MEKGEGIIDTLGSLPDTNDPVARQAKVHHDAISRNERDIIVMERRRDIALRTLDGELAEVLREFEAKRTQILKDIDDISRVSEQRIAVRRVLVRSSEAALVALEPNAATQEAPMDERRVPRGRVSVPIQIHKDIRA